MIYCDLHHNRSYHMQRAIKFAYNSELDLYRFDIDMNNPLLSTITAIETPACCSIHDPYMNTKLDILENHSINVYSYLKKQLGSQRCRSQLRSSNFWELWGLCCRLASHYHANNTQQPLSRTTYIIAYPQCCKWNYWCLKRVSVQERTPHRHHINDRSVTWSLLWCECESDHREWWQRQRRQHPG